MSQLCFCHCLKVILETDNCNFRVLLLVGFDYVYCLSLPLLTTKLFQTVSLWCLIKVIFRKWSYAGYVFATLGR